MISLIIFLIVCCIIYYFYIYPFFICPLRLIPGPRHSNPLNSLGFLPRILNEEATAPHLEWAKKYGNIFVYHGLFNQPRVVVLDSKSLQRILGTHSHIYERNQQMSGALVRILGKGLLTTFNFADHKRQRLLMNPAFSYKNIQNMVPIFALKAMGLIRRWEGMIAASTNDSSNQRLILEDVCKEFSKVTLDVIGAAGFGYEFNSIKDEHNELNQAYQEILSQISLSPWTIASQLIPGFRYLPFDRNLKMNRAVTTINAVVNKLIDERKAALKSSKEGVNTDLLAMAIAANEAEVASKRMSEEELRGQVMTFLIAGHETTSVSLSWAVFFLALHSDLQDQLFQELQNDLADKYVLPTWEQANSGLRAVENFCKEVLRLVPPVPITNRVAVQDDELQGYHIPKGSLIFLLPGVLHRQQEVWGDDCMQFNPDRWNKTSSVDEGEEAPPASHSAKPYGAFMPFLMGPRNCIGQKFAMVEFKVILAILVRNFRFEEAEQGDLSKVKKSLFVTWKPDPGVKVLISRRKG